MSETAETANETTKNFRKVGASANGNKPLRFIRPGELADAGITGLVLEGIYLGLVPNDKTGKQDFKFETDSEIVIVNSNGSLGYKLGMVQIGDLVQVSYNGKDKITKGPNAGKMAHSFDLAVADEAS